MTELNFCNQSLCEQLIALEARVALIEQNSTKKSSKRSVGDAFDAECATMSGRTKSRKKLEVKLPGKVYEGPPGLGLPTPLTSVRIPFLNVSAI